MAIETLHVLVEEPSMEAALQNLLPKMLRVGIHAEIRQFRCKDDLLKQLPQRLAGYAQWLPASAMVLIILDRDDDDCIVLKNRLEQMAHTAGLGTRQAPVGRRFQVINRIAVEELEAWFFGDWVAVKAAYPKVEATIPNKAGYRDPDGIKGGTWEAMERELQRKGYFKGGLRKLELARSISVHMDVSSNRSQSFQCLRTALARL
ncbi:DUF4276 family protein [Paracidovorax avenae]|uniref:DUF4276 family protein n=1 Tax=Paracidovorax avenae TaxID=80867 RepID=UPI001F46A91A|nr:DUF4276 family protein [Paracidovorax avenae]